MPTNNRFIAPTRKTGHNISNINMTVAILSASMGYRMKSYGPKPLIKLPDGRTLSERQIDSIRTAYPNAEIIMTVGFEADKVIKKRPEGVRIIENPFYEETNLVEEARLAINNSIYDKVMLISGDLLFNPEAIEGINTNQSSIVVDDNDMMPEENIGVTVVANKATILSYGIKDKKWCHIVYLTNKELAQFRSLCADRSKSKCFLSEIINEVLNRKCNLKAVKNTNMSVIKLESAKEFSKAGEVV